MSLCKLDDEKRASLHHYTTSLAQVVEGIPIFQRAIRGLERQTGGTS